MSQQGMLGNNDALRSFLAGPHLDLMIKLNSADGSAWEDELKKFLRKEPCWANGETRTIAQPQPAPQPFLLFLDPITIPARTEKFVPKKSYVVNTKRGAKVKIGYVDPDFTAWFGEKAEEPTAETTLRRHVLVRPAVFADAMKEVADGGFVTETTPGQLFSMLEQQPDGPKSKPGPLLANGYANIFRMIDVNGVARLVYAYWSVGSDGWAVSALGASDSAQWDGRDRLFSRSSRSPSAA
jgi:hypothetical protein